MISQNIKALFINTLVIANVFMINVQAVSDHKRRNLRYSFLYKDGDQIDDMTQFQDTVSYDNVTTQSLSITYNNTDDVTGYYFYYVYTQINRTICPWWEFYISRFGYFYSFIPVFTLYWNIRSYSELIIQNAHFNS